MLYNTCNSTLEPFDAQEKMVTITVFHKTIRSNSYDCWLYVKKQNMMGKITYINFRS